MSALQGTLVRLWPRAGAAKSTPSTATPQRPTHHDDTAESIVVRAVSALSRWGIAPGGGEGLVVDQFWKHPDTHPIVLLLMVLDLYGDESFEWEPEVLRMTLIRDKVQVSGSNWTKILAARTAVRSPSPWRQWEVFHWVSRGLAGHQPNFVFLEEPEIGHLMLGADVLQLLDPDRHTSVEVDKFVAAALKNEGGVYAPAVLGFAQRELSDPQLHCTKCHALHRDDNDTKCITCGAAALVPVPNPFADLLKECSTLFAARESSPLEIALDSLPETAAGNLVYHLLVHWGYARQQRVALGRQLHAIAITQAK